MTTTSGCPRCGGEWVEIGPRGWQCERGHFRSRVEAEVQAEAQASSQTKAPPALPAYVSRTLFDVQEEQLQVGMPGLVIFGKLSELIGDADTGKTLVALDIAARLTRGWAMPDGSPGLGEPVDVVFATAEDGLGDTIKPRANVAGADTRRIHTFEFVRHGAEQWFPSLPDDLLALEQLVQTVSARLVILDPLNAYLGSEIDAHRDHDVRRVLGPLARMAADTGSSVLSVRHLNKAQTAQVLYRGSGSIGFTASARGSMALVRPDASNDGPERILAKVKYNLGPSPQPLRLLLSTFDGQPCVKWIGAAEGFDLGTALGPRQTDEEPGEVSDAQRFLRDELGNEAESATVPELQAAARAAGVAWRSVERAKRRLGVEHWREGFGRGAVYRWRLPAPGADNSSAMLAIPSQDTEHGEHGEHGRFEGL